MTKLIKQLILLLTNNNKKSKKYSNSQNRSYYSSSIRSTSGRGSRCTRNIYGRQDQPLTISFTLCYRSQFTLDLLIIEVVCITFLLIVIVLAITKDEPETFPIKTLANITAGLEHVSLP